MTNITEDIQKKLSHSQELFSQFTSTHSTSRSKESNKSDIETGTPYEVFRNNTTSVEVIVKEVPCSHSKMKKESIISKSLDMAVGCEDATIKKLQTDVNNLKTELYNAQTKLADTRNFYTSLMVELKKQMDAANEKEIEKQSKSLGLELENEKLKALLDFKSNLINKLKKELNGMKRILKFVIKSFSFNHMIDNNGLSSDDGYDEFENELKRKVGRKGFELFERFKRQDSKVSKEPNSF